MMLTASSMVVVKDRSGVTDTISRLPIAVSPVISPVSSTLMDSDSFAGSVSGSVSFG